MTRQLVKAYSKQAALSAFSAHFWPGACHAIFCTAGHTVRQKGNLLTNIRGSVKISCTKSLLFARIRYSFEQVFQFSLTCYMEYGF